MGVKSTVQLVFQKRFDTADTVIPHLMTAEACKQAITSWKHTRISANRNSNKSALCLCLDVETGAIVAYDNVL